MFRERIKYQTNYAIAAAAALFVFLFLFKFGEVSLFIFSYLLFWFAFTEFPVLGRFRRLPDISYGTYLYGWPVQKLLTWYLPNIQPWPLFWLSLAGSLACGLLSWYLVEQPFLRFKKKLA